MGVWLRKSSHRIHRSLVASVLPRNSRNSQKLGCISPPTDFTDLHRWLGCVCSPTDFTEFTEFWGCCWLRGYGRMPYPPNLCASVPICGRYFSARRFCVFCAFCGNIVSHGFHRSTQMVGCVNSPTEFTEFTEVWGCCWQRGYGSMPYPPNLCASVPICGRSFSARRFRVFRAFCGRYFSARRFCAFRAFCGRFFSTRRVRSVGGTSQPEE